MKHLLLILFISFSINSYTQTNEFAPIGAKWWYNYELFSAVGYRTIESIGDTIIEGHTCRILASTKYIKDLSLPDPQVDTITNPDWNIYLYSDLGVVYQHINHAFYTLYDFNASIGDSWTVYGHDSGDVCDSIGLVEVYDASTINLNGFDLKQVYVDSVPGDYWTYNNKPCIERIGSLQYLLPDPQQCLLDYYEGGPLRCYYDPEFGYYSVDTSTTCDFILAVDNPINTTLAACFPNPFNDVLHISMNNSHTQAAVYVYDLSGKLIYQTMMNETQLDINTSNWPANLYWINIISHQTTTVSKLVKL